MPDDPYLEMIKQQWPLIADAYNQYAEQQPIMLVDVQNNEIVNSSCQISTILV